VIPQDLTTKVGNSIVVENSSIQLRTAPGQSDKAGQKSLKIEVND